MLELLGYTPSSTPADANIIWAYADPFTKQNSEQEPKLAAAHEHLRNLQQFQFVNFLPSLGFLASKPELAKLSAQLKSVPRTFQLPGEYKAWQEFLKTEQGAKMQWLQKSKGHRGITIIEDPSASSLKEWDKDILVQQLVRPYLIDNRLWDVGVYVAITSLEPLLAYVHTGGVLLRFCSGEYVRDIKPHTPSQSYIIHGLEDYTHPTQVEGMLPHFADAGNDTNYGTSMTLTALRSYLDSKGVDSQKWWLDVQTAILQALQKTTPLMRAQQAVKYTGQRTNFFSLLRFDLMLDENLDTYLIEVNVSPGLHRPDMPPEEQLLSRKLIHDLLLLKGLGPGGHHHQFTRPGLLNVTFHPDSIALGEPVCAGGCETAEQCHSKEACMLCRICRSDWQNGVLQRVMAEHLGSHGFMRVHPPHQVLEQHMQQVGVQGDAEVEDRPDDRLVRAWLAARCKQDFRWC